MAFITKKICMNPQCGDSINEASATVCKGCGANLARVDPRRLNKDKLEEEVEKIRNQKRKTEDDGDSNPAGTGGADEPKETEEKKEEEYVICPECEKRIIFRPGLETCPNCGEYVAHIAPITGEDTGDAEQKDKPVSALRSLDGKCRLQLEGDWLKVGREAFGREYFESEGKRKVSREHAIMRRIEGAWHISYCKKEDRNYSGGIENPIFINGQRVGREENVRLQIGDEIGFAERDYSYTTAAFFRAE